MHVEMSRTLHALGVFVKCVILEYVTWLYVCISECCDHVRLWTRIFIYITCGEMMVL